MTLFLILQMVHSCLVERYWSVFVTVVSKFEGRKKRDGQDCTISGVDLLWFLIYQMPPATLHMSKLFSLTDLNLI